MLGLRFTPPNNALTTIPALANVGTGGGSIAHLASGGDGWQTTFVLVNTGTSAAQATLSFFNDQTGAPLSLPLDVSASQRRRHTTVPSVTQATGGRGDAGDRQQRSAETAHRLGAAHHHRKRQRVCDLPPQRPGSRGAAGEPQRQRLHMAFDNTNGTATGMAVNAVSTQTGEHSGDGSRRHGRANRDRHDHLGRERALCLHAGDRQISGRLSTIRGTIEFDKPADAQIGALGIRIPNVAAHTYTTLPALAK